MHREGREGGAEQMRKRSGITQKIESDFDLHLKLTKLNEFNDLTEHICALR